MIKFFFNKRPLKAMLVVLVFLFYVGCVEEEEEPQPVDTNAEIQAALDAGTPIDELLEDYLRANLYGFRYEGGYIAYIDKDDRTVLISGTEDIASDVDFYDQGSFFFEGFTNSGFGDGEANTLEVIDELGSSGNVAALCNNYSSQGFSDWFLPSKLELTYIRANVYRKGVGNFPGGENNARYYWHSHIRKSQTQGTCPQAIQFVTETETCVSSASVRPARYSIY